MGKIKNFFRGRAAKDEPKKLDTTPMEIPAGYRLPRPLTEVIAGMVRTAVEAEKGVEFESPDEADDFEMDDDELLDLSPYEFTDLTEEEPVAPKPRLRVGEKPDDEQEEDPKTTPPEDESSEEVE